jgi:hypothetical protein
MKSDDSQERVKGMKILKRTLVTLTPEERGLFAVFHSEKKCYGKPETLRCGCKMQIAVNLTLALANNPTVQKQLFEMIKKRKSPKFGNL